MTRRGIAAVLPPEDEDDDETAGDDRRRRRRGGAETTMKPRLRRAKKLLRARPTRKRPRQTTANLVRRTVNRRSSFFVVGLLAGCARRRRALAIPASPLQQKPDARPRPAGRSRGDAAGGSAADRELTEEDLNRSVDIMRNRVDKLGVTEPEIRTQGDDQIVIQLPGVSDPEAAAEIIGTTAQLELYDLEASLAGPSISVARLPGRAHVALRPARQGAEPGRGRPRTRTTS